MIDHGRRLAAALAAALVALCGYGCSNDCEAPDGFEFFCERFEDYCDCGPKPTSGTLGERVSTCEAAEFEGGNCCFHPDTASCRCDGYPGCSRSGTPVSSCSEALSSCQ